MANGYNPGTVMNALERRDYELVVREAFPCAAAGNPAAQCMVSLLYQCGYGVERDLAKAEEEWLLRATAQNDTLWDDPLHWHIVDGHTLRERNHKWREEGDIPGSFSAWPQSA